MNRRLALVVSLLGLAALPAAAQDAPKPTYGHSMQGEAFNEGPRQRAYLMKGMAAIHFPISARNPRTQRFVEQGIGQLHAYWYFEAERSFRQAARLNPDAAIPYWGMALANVNNPTRAKALIAEAMKRRDKANSRERAWIEAYAAFLNADGDSNRRERYIAALQKIVDTYPDDTEAKAFLAHEKLEAHYSQPGRWDMAQRAQAVRTAREIDKLIDEVLAESPMHPIHHYRIHLWNFGEANAFALTAAANCGVAEPGIAHMWHMCGHTYSGLQRYTDAVYYQEASARVDHAHMMRDMVLPDQIHNYAHNNQWLAENLVYVGRAADALTIARNMIALPRHPSYNRPGSGGSADQGRMRLMQDLNTFEMWPEALALEKSGELEAPSIPRNRIDRLELLGVAAFATGDIAAGKRWRNELFSLVPLVGPKLEGLNQNQWKDALARVDLEAALAAGDRDAAKALLPTVGGLTPLERARYALRLEDWAEAEKSARQAVDQGKNQVAPLAALVEALWKGGAGRGGAELRERFTALRTLAGDADRTTAPMRRLAPIARALGLPEDWRTPAGLPEDAGQRPKLSSLGPLTWAPTPLPTLSAVGVDGAPLKRTPGRATLLALYLGTGCERCMQQLNALAPLADEFAKAGIDIRAVSPESREVLTDNAKTMKVPFPLYADPKLRTFKALRAYDDFEEMPLHGLYLIDAAGKLRWFDVSYQAFTDAKFVLEEAKRLLAQPI